MIQHVVAFRFRGDSLAARNENAEQAAAWLTPMAGRIDGLDSLDVRQDLGREAGHWDLVLISRHDTWEALRAYMEHPLHLSAKAVIDTIVLDRAIVDSVLGDGVHPAKEGVVA